MKEKYIKIRNLSVSEKLFRFVNEELLLKTKINWPKKILMLGGQLKTKRSILATRTT